MRILSCIWSSMSRKELLRLSCYYKTFNQLQSAGNPKASHLLLSSFEDFFPLLSTQDKNLTRLDSRPLKGLVFRMCFLACITPWCSQHLAHLWLTLSSSVGRLAAGTLAATASSWVRLHLMEVSPNCKIKNSAVEYQHWVELIFGCITPTSAPHQCQQPASTSLTLFGVGRIWVIPKTWPGAVEIKTWGIKLLLERNGHFERIILLTCFRHLHSDEINNSENVSLLT